MAWQPKNKPWYAAKSVVRAIRMGPNTVRYQAVKQVEKEEEEEEVVVASRGTYNNYYNYNNYNNNRNSYYNPMDSDEEDWYSTRKAQAKKKTYTFSSKEWNSYNFYTFLDINNDDNSTLFVKEPESYLTPTAQQIKSRAAVWEAKSINKIKDLARICYLKMLDDRDFISEYAKEYLKGNDNYYDTISFYSELYDQYIPGFTPLEQAIAIHYQLEDKKAKSKDSDKIGFHRENVGFKREVYADSNMTNQLDMNSLSSKKKMEILNKISIIGDLGNQFKVEKAVGEREVHNSHIFRKKLMKDYSQFNNIDMYQRMLPNFKLRFLTKDLIVNVPVQTSEKKQILIIILDDSGSMNDTLKQIWVNALLIDRFRYVITGEAEIYFSEFVYYPEDLKFRHIKNEEDVKKFWKNFNNYPNGGATNIGRIVTDISEKVASKNFYGLGDLSQTKPEILIINDANDSIGYDSLPYKTNAVCLMKENSELKNLCINSGGKQVVVNSKDRIVAYSLDGEEIISE